ncbi:MAG TPA: glycosyltransferase [Actinomycetota bacterium]|jgi:glycosyltransferase involved in cell wall biosynthesis|nr:glycosyltransferase [Actinomycetota bacterium]
MRIAMVSEHASPLAALGGVDAGGQNVHVASLAAQLGRKGVEVVVYTRRDDPSLPRRVKIGRCVEVEHVDAGPPEPVFRDDLLPYMDEFAAYLARAWRSARPDIVHSHFWMSGKAALPAAIEYDIPLVHTFHALGTVKRRNQGAKDTSPPERIPEEKRIAKGADRIVATCTDEVFELKRMRADVSNISVVPCGVDLTRFRPRGPSWPRAPGLRRLVVVSRLVERKGIGNVITALAEIPGTELLIAGGPPKERLAQDAEAVRLNALAEKAGVADRVRFLGRIGRDEVPALMRSADVVVCVPWYEPFGIVPVEAMACGAPVVATAVGGMIDTVVHGLTGIHVPPRRCDVLAQAIRKILDDEDLRRSLGQNGARRARAKYGWGSVAAASMNVYLQVIAERSVARRGALQ